MDQEKRSAEEARWEPQIKQIQEMGFSRSVEEIRSSLKKYDGNLDFACSDLLSSPSSDDDDSEPPPLIAVFNWENELMQIQSMGFEHSREEIERALNDASGSVEVAMEFLLQH